MAATYKTPGIILKRWNHKEKDKMMRIFTPEHGKITVRAISARKIKSKLAGHLEPFIYSDLFIACSKTIDIVAGSNTIQSHARLRHSLTHSALANYFAEIIDRLTQEEQEDPELFDHTLSFYQWLNDNEANLLVLHAAVIHLFAILGYRLELYDCHSCKRPILQEGSKFHYGLLNVECHECSGQDETIRLSVETIKMLRFATEHAFPAMVHLHVSPQVWIEFHSFMRSLLRYHVERELYSEESVFSMMAFAEV
jgi:DNA repair protein RecO (recombination protein O)